MKHVAYVATKSKVMDTTQHLPPRVGAAMIVISQSSFLHECSNMKISNTMEELNKVILRGIVGSFRKSTIQGRQFVHLSVVTNRIAQRDDEKITIESTWHSVESWSVSDEVLATLEKGSRVEIEGRLRNSRYTTDSGEDMTTTVIVATSLKVIPDGTIVKMEE